MRQRVEKIIQNCVACILAERKHGKQEDFLNPIEKEIVPLDTLHIDHLYPRLRRSRYIFQYIFAVIDAFSKFTWLYATRSTGTAEVIVRLKNKLQFSAIHDGLFLTEVQRSRQMNLENIAVTKI